MPITNRFLEPSDDNRHDEITHYHVNIDQDFDQRTGLPVGRPVLNNITIQITRNASADAPYYVKWQMDPTATRDLDIGFYNNNQLVRSIKIRETYLINYTQQSSIPGIIEETLVLSPQLLEIDGVTYNREDYL